MSGTDPTGHRAGRHFLQIPGPTNVPDRVLRALSRPTIDHRGPEFRDLAMGLLADVRHVFQTTDPVLIFPGSGTGVWESTLVNTCAPGGRILMFDMGHFARLWARMARELGLDVEVVDLDWRAGVTPADVTAALAEERFHAVAIVHNETSTGFTTDLAGIRRAIDASGQDPLLFVDAVSSLASIDLRHDEWGIDVTVASSQKGLMLPPGLGFAAVSDRARAVAASGAGVRRSYWDWEAMFAANDKGSFPYTPATNLLYGLREAIDLLDAEGLDRVFARHEHLAGMTRVAVEHWGLEILATDPARRSNSCTSVVMPDGHDADRLRDVILEHYDLSLGGGLSDLAGTVFRIGHLGDLNELTLAGTLAGVEGGLRRCGVPITPGGVEAAIAHGIG